MTMMSDDGQEAIHPQKTKTKYGDYWELANVIQMTYIYIYVEIPTYINVGLFYTLVSCNTVTTA